MTGSTLQTAARARRHTKGLVLIAVYKLLLALFFVALGVGALRLVGKDVGDLASQIASDLKFNPEGRFVHFILERASLLEDRTLHRIGLGAFCYAVISLAEGIGLYLEKAWAEYLTLVITASFLPWEILEIIHRHTFPRIGLLVVNVAVLIYLSKLVWERKRGSKRAVPAPGAEA